VNCGYLDSPIGPLLLAGDADGLHQVLLPSSARQPADLPPGWRLHQAALSEAVAQFEAYFAGKLKQFELALVISGTSFQRQVLTALQQIPYGETRSYRDIAIAVERPKAVRAVGAANARNPLPIVIPCHRVIGQNGKLTGFAGGLEAKAALLALEQDQTGLL